MKLYLKNKLEYKMNIYIDKKITIIYTESNIYTINTVIVKWFRLFIF